MTTISISTELDVLAKYTSLMENSLSSESFYARTKDTLNEYFKNNSINNNDRAQVLANTLSSITNSLSSTAMSVALQWSTNEVELGLKKLEMEKQLDILAEQKKLVQAQANKAANDNIATQAEIWRMYGKPTAIDGVLTALTDDCKLYWDIQSSEETSVNLGKEGNLLDSRLNESYAAIHKTVADTVVNYGPWTYNLTSTGIQDTPVRGSVNGGGADFAVLSDVQRVIAKEQAKGYAYNAWANAVTASAGMVGTIVASDGLNIDVAPIVALSTGIMRNLGSAKDAYRVGEVPLPEVVTTP